MYSQISLKLLYLGVYLVILAPFGLMQISGAIVDILDSKSSRSERVAQISGTPEQKRSAENLIQAFIMAT